MLRASWGELCLAAFTTLFSVAAAPFKKQFSDGLLELG
jgi:hypothetical protein